MMDSPRMFTGKTVDEATEDALATLNVDLEDVEIRVVSPGRSGILGFGGEPARVEIRLVGQAAARAAQSEDNDDDSDSDDDDVRETEAVAEAPEEQEERPGRAPRSRSRGTRTRGARTGSRGGRSGSGRQRPESKRSEDDDAPARPQQDRSEDRPQSRSQDRPQNRREEDSPQEDEPQRESHESRPPVEQEYEDRQPREREDDRPPAERDAEAEQLVAEVLDYFLATMGVVAETYVRDDTEDGSLVFEIEGEDAGLLIGRRGETLQALQFLVRMVVSRQLGRKAYVMVDVEDYRQRRAEMLRRLARRTAGRVASSGRSSALDPMPPGERRIVHMSLASNNRVKTESEGEGNQRRVVILPRR